MELYVHLPFCKQKCGYCDFASFPGMENLMDAYVSALLAEAELNAEEIAEPIETAYIGGGTPSLLEPETMRGLLRGLRERLPLERVTEWTCEANPGTLTPAWLEAALEGGINRMSLGMQTAQDRLLQMMRRVHDAEAVFHSVRMAREAGFQNLSLDLIFGFPSQTSEEWRESLDAAFTLRPQHISAYGLIPEEGTPLNEDLQAGRMILPEPEEERAMYETLLRECRKHGFKQYEISNFALPGYECRHNIGYWTQVPYLGLGLSAASMLRVSWEAEGMSYLRRTNTANMDDYLMGIDTWRPYYAEEGWISPREARFETMMLGLRMTDGIRETDFRARHGISMADCYGKKLEKLRRDGMVERINGSWRLTRLGMDLQNTALVELMD